MTRVLLQCQALDGSGNVVAEAPVTLRMDDGWWCGRARLVFDDFVNTHAYRLVGALGEVFAKRERAAGDYFDSLFPGDAVEIDWRVEPEAGLCPA